MNEDYQRCGVQSFFISSIPNTMGKSCVNKKSGVNMGDLGKISEISRSSVLLREVQLSRFTDGDATRHVGYQCH